MTPKANSWAWRSSTLPGASATCPPCSRSSSKGSGRPCPCPQSPREGAMSEELRRRVLELYREADREVAAAGPVCVASGRCCRFKEYGHVLYLSNLEADVLLHGAPP